MNYQEVLEAARPCMGKVCKACVVCNGKACGNQIPGPGAKGVGDVAIRNYEAWQKIRVNMDTLKKKHEVDTSIQLFGKTFRYPFFAGPVGAVNLHYGDKYNDMTYNDVLVAACADAGIAAFTGDGTSPEVVKAAAAAIKERGGAGIPTIKPWNFETIQQKLALVKEAGAYAVAMDIDAAGLPFLKNMEPPAGAKSVEEMSQIIREAGLPFIIKGIMTVKGAVKAKKAGAAAIVVSNHGGRVLDQCPATAEVLENIVDAVGGSMRQKTAPESPCWNIRSGVDVFKALAMGADGVLIARPFVTAVYGAGAEGVQVYVDKIAGELKDTMEMCGAYSIGEISREKIWK